jgi:hypothetical protein
LAVAGFLIPFLRLSTRIDMIPLNATDEQLEALRCERFPHPELQKIVKVGFLVENGVTVADA